MIFTFSCQSQKSGEYVLSPIEFNTHFQQDSNAVIIDVRTPEEFQEKHIRNAVNIDYQNDDFEKLIKELDKQKAYYVYCRSGKRSSSAIEIMQKNNFSNLYELKGGILSWEEEKMVTVE